MHIDVSGLLAPVSEDNPVGDDLLDTDFDGGDPKVLQEVRKDYRTVEKAFEVAVSEVNSSQSASWADIIDKIAKVGRHTKHISLPVFVCQAGVRLKDFEVVAAGVEYLTGLVDSHWADLHPGLHHGWAPASRRNFCQALGGKAFGAGLKTVGLFKDRRGTAYAIGDVLTASADPAGAGRRVAGVLKAEVATDALTERLAAMGAGLERVQTATGANLADTIALVGEVGDAVAALASGAAAPATQDAAGPEASPSAAAASGAAALPPGAPAMINSRADVVRALDAIGDYYKRAEPSSPVRLILERAKTWVELDFLAILDDIVPGSLEDVARVLVSRPKEETEE
jgi:type VI secretion system protein ImpA